MKYQNQKTCIKYEKKVKEMKNGYKIQTYPTKLEKKMIFQAEQLKQKHLLIIFYKK